MSLESRYDVVIVGAGPAGATTALAIHYYTKQSGSSPLKVLVIDKRSADRKRSNTILLDAAPANALERLGCDISSFTQATDWCQISPEANVINRYPLPSYRRHSKSDVCFHAGHMLRRTPVFDVSINTLEKELYRSIESHNNLTLVHEAELIGLEASRDSTMLKIAKDDEIYQAECSFVVAADGAHSQTLELFGAHKKGRRDLETIISAHFEQAGLGNTKFHNNNRSFEALALATQQGTSVFVKVPTELLADNTPETQSAIKETLIQGAKKLGVTSKIAFGYSLIAIVLERASKSIYDHSLFVIGDARHATTPRVALGANASIMDALRAGKTIVKIQSASLLTRSWARQSFRFHTWLGTHILTLLGRITTSSQAIKSTSTRTTASSISKLYTFWKTQILMSLHWSAGRGESLAYSEERAKELLEVARKGKLVESVELREESTSKI